MHDAALRGADVDSLELIFGSDFLFNELGGLAANVREIPAVLGPHVLINLQDLDPRFRDLALGLRGRGNQLSTLAFETRVFALECRDAVELDELLAPELADTLKLFLDPLDLLFFGRDLRGEAADFFFRLRDALVELRFEPFARLAPDLEKSRLTGQGAFDFGVVPTCHEIGRKRDAVRAVDLGLLARLAGAQARPAP